MCNEFSRPVDLILVDGADLTATPGVRLRGSKIRLRLVAAQVVLSVALAGVMMAGCDSRGSGAAETQDAAVRYPGRSSALFVYMQTDRGEYEYLCSGTLVKSDSGPKGAGVLTAAHCFSLSGREDLRGYFVAAGRGGPYVGLSRAWIGDPFKGQDIAWAEIDAKSAGQLGTVNPAAIAMKDPGTSEGDAVWTWGNPDNKGVYLSVGYIMGRGYSDTVKGVADGEDITFDLNGQYIVDLNTSPGSSGGALISKAGVLGVLSGHFRHESGFKFSYITPIGRLSAVLAQPPSEALPWGRPPARKP